MQKRVKVKPNSKQQKIEELADGSLTVYLKSPPVDGKANEELIKLLAKKFDVSKSSIRIKSGTTSRQKVIEIDGI
ncbi:MAG: YggU family protein [Dolichospermum sp. DL01]|nr:MAG: YggU family protein [Dolichospermum sp. DL01]